MFPLGTFVTLTAAKEHRKMVFAGWRVSVLSDLTSPSFVQVNGASIDILILGDEQTIEAVYEARQSVPKLPMGYIN